MMRGALAFLVAAMIVSSTVAEGADDFLSVVPTTPVPRKPVSGAQKKVPHQLSTPATMGALGSQHLPRPDNPTPTTPPGAQAEETQLYCVMRWKDGSNSKIHNETFTVDPHHSKVTDTDGDHWDAKISENKIEFDQVYKNVRWQIAIDRNAGTITEATYKDNKYDPGLDRIGDCSVRTKKF